MLPTSPLQPSNLYPFLIWGGQFACLCQFPFCVFIICLYFFLKCVCHLLRDKEVGYLKGRWLSVRSPVSLPPHQSLRRSCKWQGGEVWRGGEVKTGARRGRYLTTSPKLSPLDIGFLASIYAPFFIIEFESSASSVKLLPDFLC